MELSDEAQVWNRAALEAGGSNPCAGDSALAALLLVHGMVMNGGVEHAIETLSSAEMSVGIAGYRYFSFHDVARMLEDAAGEGLDDEDDAEAADHRYAEIIPEDRVVLERFRAVFAVSPSAFGPV